MRKSLALLLALLLTLALAPGALGADWENYAWPVQETVRVDDAIESLPMCALLDEDGYATNYVKVRDVAYILSGTGAQFAVDYYGGMVHMVPGWAYVPNGKELAAPFLGPQSFAWVGERTDIAGQMTALSAIRLTDRFGGGHTYYKLRDLGAVLGFGVDWSQEKGVYLSAPLQR